MQCQLIWLDIPVCEAIVDGRDQARVSRSVTIIWVEMIRWQITNSVFDQSKLIRSWADSGFGQRVESATWYYIYISCDPDNRFLRCPVFWITWTSPSRHPGRVALIPNWRIRIIYRNGKTRMSRWALRLRRRRSRVLTRFTGRKSIHAARQDRII